MFRAMNDVASMRERIVYLQRQAQAFREFSAASKNQALCDQLEDLAKRCDEIAANIARNLPIHERAR